MPPVRQSLARCANVLRGLWRAFGETAAQNMVGNLLVHSCGFCGFLADTIGQKIMIPWKDPSFCRALMCSWMACFSGLSGGYAPGSSFFAPMHSDGNPQAKAVCEFCCVK